jgi:hypothetical protein
MISVNKWRSNVVKLIQDSKHEAEQRGRKIETIDPVLKTAKRLFPLHSGDELYELSSTALRMILNEPEPQFQQTTLLVHI